MPACVGLQVNKVAATEWCSFSLIHFYDFIAYWTCNPILTNVQKQMRKSDFFQQQPFTAKGVETKQKQYLLFNQCQRGKKAMHVSCVNFIFFDMTNKIWIIFTAALKRSNRRRWRMFYFGTEKTQLFWLKHLVAGKSCAFFTKSRTTFTSKFSVFQGNSK